MGAARAAEAAALQRRFWEMHDTLYDNQDSLDAESLLHYAADLQLDLPRFIRDIGRTGVKQKIAYNLYGGALRGAA